MVSDTITPTLDFVLTNILPTPTKIDHPEVVTNTDGTNTTILRDHTGKINGYITRDAYGIKEEGQLKKTGGPVFMNFYNRDGVKLSDEQLSPRQRHQKETAAQIKPIEEWHVTGFFSQSGNIHFHFFETASTAIYNEHGIPQFPDEHRDSRIPTIRENNQFSSPDNGI